MKKNMESMKKPHVHGYPESAGANLSYLVKGYIMYNVLDYNIMSRNYFFFSLIMRNHQPVNQIVDSCSSTRRGAVGEFEFQKPWSSPPSWSSICRST